MQVARSITGRCPTCRKPSSKDGNNKVFPFCGERCQLVDLGRWLREEYRVPGDPVDPSTLPVGTPDQDDDE